MSWELTPSLLQKIKGGQAVLFLGAGASIGASHPMAKSIPNGNNLRDLICDKFLGGKLKDRPLVEVSELAKNEASLVDFQSYLQAIFSEFEPALHHELIADFRWKAIVTTNFDLVIEKAYQKNKKALQKIYPVKHDADELETKMLKENSLIYLKVHGCVTDFKNTNYPMIVATEEYARYKKNRHSIFAHLKELGKSSPLIFCGYNLSDPNINEILFDLGDMGIDRPMYVVVDPNLSDFHIRLWSAKRFFPVKMTFESFLKYLDDAIDTESRKLAYWRDNYSSEFQKYFKDGFVSPELNQYLDNEFFLLDKCENNTGVSPQNFYKGADQGWGAFSSNLDIERGVVTDIMNEAFSVPSTGTRVFLIKGHAGCGKTVVMKRLAYNAYTNHNEFCLFLKPGGTIKPALLNELSTISLKKINVFISENYFEDLALAEFIKDSVQSRCLFNIFIEARTNEWNIHGEEYVPYVYKEFDVRSLNQKNIENLLDKLSSFNLLGYMKKFSRKEQIEYCLKRADRQLLVMLYEITSGESFENIVIDEYNNILPPEAKVLYMDICTLHRFNIGVRAGLISRVSGIGFESFEKNFFAPLENLVFTYEDYLRGDIYFKTRHQDIAEIVFEKGIPTSQERVEQILRIIKCLNLDYTVDSNAFLNLVRGKTLSKIFGNRNDIDTIFDAAISEFGDLPVLWHQRAVFELNHATGSIEKALTCVDKAILYKDKTDLSLMHTKADVLRIMANKSSSKTVRAKLRNSSKSLLKDFLNGATTYYVSSYLRVLLDELKDNIEEISLAKEGSTLLERVAVDLCREIDSIFSKTSQKFPGDEFLLQLKSEYNSILEKEGESKKILEQALDLNPNSIFLALRVASLQASSSVDSAITTLRNSLKLNHNSKDINFNLAKYLGQKDQEKNAEEIIHCLNKSFTMGDSNYIAQFWYGFYQYNFGDKVVASKIFDSLKKAKLPPATRSQVRESLPKLHHGKIVKLHTDFLFIECSDFAEHIFAHITNLGTDEHWSNFYYRTEITFQLGFTLLGPCGINLKKRTY